jgi:hypothetical protein
MHVAVNLDHSFPAVPPGPAPARTAVPAPRNLSISGAAPVTHDEPPVMAPDPGKLRPEGWHSGGESVCRPGPVQASP